MATDERLPIWLRPEPGTRRPRFTRDQIAATALAIADADGFEAVSMRRVAAELGAGTMTLYHYVRTKDDLVALMDDALMGEVIVPDGELPVHDWRAALRTIACSSRDAFMRHPWALDALRGAPFGPNGTRHFDQSLASVQTLDLDPAAKLQLLATVDDYVFGFIVRQAGSRPERTMSDDDSDDFDALIAFTERLLEHGDYPHVEQLLGREDRRAVWEQLVSAWGDGRFERGLEQLLDGIALDLERRGALPAAAPQP